MYKQCNVLFLEPPSVGIMENVMFWSRQARELWKTYCFSAARRGSNGKHIVFQPPGAGAMENDQFLSPELPKTIRNTIKRAGGKQLPVFSIVPEACFQCTVFEPQAHGKRNGFEPPVAEAIEKVLFLRRQAREVLKTYCF